MPSKYQQDVRVDGQALDSQWIELPTLLLEYGELLGDASAERGRLKTELDLVAADCDAQLRNDMEKRTEASIKNEIIRQPRYQKAVRALADAQRNYDAIQAALNALMGKKSALDNLTRLYLAGYYGSGLPASGREMQEVGNQKDKEQQVGRLTDNPRMTRKPPVRKPA